MSDFLSDLNFENANGCFAKIIDEMSVSEIDQLCSAYDVVDPSVQPQKFSSLLHGELRNI